MNQPFEDRVALSNSSELIENSYKKKTSLNEPLKYVTNADVNPDVIKNILLDIQPIKIMKQSKELGTSKDFYDDEDFEDDRYKCFKLYYIICIIVYNIECTYLNFKKSLKSIA